MAAETTQSLTPESYPLTSMIEHLKNHTQSVHRMYHVLEKILKQTSQRNLHILKENLKKKIEVFCPHGMESGASYIIPKLKITYFASFANSRK